MKNKRMLAMVAMISLLAGMLAVGGLLPASAVTDGWTVDDGGNGQYKTFAQYDNAYLTGLGTSLVKDVVPYRKASSDATPWTLSGTWSGYQHQDYAAESVLNITDGVIRSSSTDTTTDKFTSKHRGTTSTWFFIFDLGELYDLTDFVLASSQNDGANYVLRNARIYVSDNLDTPISSDKLVYSRWGAAADENARNFHVQPADGEAVTGRYVSFEILHTGDNFIRIEELAVFGTKHIDWVNGDTVGESAAGRYTTFAQYDNAYLTGMGTSLVKDSIPYYGTGSTLWSADNRLGANAAYLTDGAIRTSKTDATTASANFNAGQNNVDRNYVFHLGARYDLTDFVVASSQTDTAAIYLLHSVRIFVSDDLSTLFDDSNQVYSRWGEEENPVDLTNRNFRIQPTGGKAVSGQYVGFRLQTGSSDKVLRVEELGVYGKARTDWTDATEGRYLTYNRFTQLGTIMGDATSLIAGKTAYGSDFTNDGDTVQDWYNETSKTGGHQGQYSGYDKGATDGQIASSVDDCETTEAIFRGSAVNHSRYFYYDLGATYDISDFVVASSQSDNTLTVLKNIRIHVAENWSMETAFTATKGRATGVVDSNGVPVGFTKVYDDWSVGSCTYTYRIQPAAGETVTARYVCFELSSPATSNQKFPIPVGELAVYGSPVETVKSLGGQVATYVSNNSIAKLRLGFSVDATGITRDETNYKGNYTNAMVTVGDKSYPIAIDEETGKPIIGALIARGGEGQAVPEDLVIGSSNSGVHPVHAEKLYDVGTDKITFTALVTNVPSSHFDEQIIGRVYVGYVDDNQTVRYIYGKLLSRSVDDVKQNTNMQ